MTHSRKSNSTRREFLAAASAGAVLGLAAPAIVTAKRTERQKTIVGQGEHQFEIHHDWAKLPEKYHWQTTHNVALDRDGFLYVMHEGRVQESDHPSIFVFDPNGDFVRAFGNQFQGGGHGIEVREEDGDQYLYVCGYQQVKSFSKMDLKGNIVWQRNAPMQSELYAKGEDTKPEKIWGRDRFMPTNFAFLPDGDFFLADGYGSFHIHRYNKDGEWLSCFGGPGDGEGKFNTPHGIWVDARDADDPKLVVTDRAHHTVQILSLDGKHLQTLEGFGLPANIDTLGDLMLVPELIARVSILGPDNQVVAHLGDDGQRIRDDEGFKIRGDEKRWNAGKFVHPHDACFDPQGNIFVAEWVSSGRISKLSRLA